MELAAAVGLASAVIQLVDFSARTTRETASLIRNSKTAPDAVTRLSDLGKSNHQLNDNILHLLATRSPLDQDEELVRNIAQNLRASWAKLLELGQMPTLNCAVCQRDIPAFVSELRDRLSSELA